MDNPRSGLELECKVRTRLISGQFASQALTLPHLIPSGSGMKASLGAVSGALLEVVQRTPSPGSGLDATQPAGRAGATTLSKFSFNKMPHGDVVAAGVAVAVAVAVTVEVAVGAGD